MKPFTLLAQPAAVLVPVYIGLAVSNHHHSQLNTSYFDFVSTSFGP